MTKITLITILTLFGCFESPETVVSSKKDTGIDAVASLERSSESLDRTLTSMNLMVEDMKRMNRNLDAIFKAVTDCKTPAECEALKAELYEKHLQENTNKITE
tara:strand:- start:379 stop:687 length:309 start_codon:yes stop_codon:yes gene_type:complete